MNRSSAFRTAIAASIWVARALLSVSVVSCGDNDPRQASSQAQGGAGSSAGADSPETAAGENGRGGAGVAATGAAGAESTAEAGAAGSGPDTGGDAGAPNRGGPCSHNSDCDDGLYCNGAELCKELFPGSDAKVCMAPEHGPCGTSACDEATGKCDCRQPDKDGDGYKVAGCTVGHEESDCDDTDGNRYPHNTEICNDHDEDCDDNTYGNTDTDKDGFFDSNCLNKLYYQPLFSTSDPPLIASGTDCDDHNAFVHPGAVEVCDNLDNNCNGLTDEVSGGQGDPHTYYRDQDGDYWGSDDDPLHTLCNFPPAGYSVLHGDCNDKDPGISPAREEICNGVDDDCNGTTDQPGKPGELMFGQPYDGVTDFQCTGVPGWKVKTCPSGRLDCNQSYLDACETIGTTLCNCHACGRTCAFSCGETDCEEIAAISTGKLHVCAIAEPTGTTSGGTITCWGRNLSGQLGNGSTKDSPRPIPVPDLTNVTAVSSGDLHSCAIASGGRLLCWGSNKFGQLGGAVLDAFLPYPVEIHQSSPKLGAKRISSGAFHTCAIFEDGRLACWGEGDHGELGNGHAENQYAPVRVERLVNDAPEFVNGASQVVAGDQHTCALSDGRVECWGDNSSQQLGVDPKLLGSSLFARPVVGLEGLQIEEISASAYHTCARAGANVYCWGSNLDHELALESGDFGPPSKIPLPIPAVGIATGTAFGCALGNAGTAYCWGSNDSGERGTSDATPSVLPNPIPVDNLVGIFAGRGALACGITRTAQAWCWGDNRFGTLGNGATSLLPTPTPSRVLSLTDAPACF